MSFLRAALGSPTPFVGVPSDSPFFSMGNGINSPAPANPGGGHSGGGGGGHGHGGGGTGGGTPPIGPVANDPQEGFLTTLRG
jgi:hypothetical protein